MSRPPLYKTAASPLPAILEALRGGADLTAAATLGGVQVATLAGWMSRDPEVSAQVEEAQALARAPGHPGFSSERPEATPRDRWAQVHAEAAALGPGLYGYLLWLEGRVAEYGQTMPRPAPPMPRFLRRVFRDFFASGKQELLILGGRGLGKSTIFCRPTLVECLGAEPVTNGEEIAVWAELSVDMDEAGLKLGVLKFLLRAAGFREDPARKDDDEGTYKVLSQERGRSRIQFRNFHRERIEIRVYPATVAALSGPTLKGARHDEEQKWRKNAKDGTSSAQEVLDAEGGAFRGRAHAHLYRMSSAYSTDTPHHRDAHGIVVDDGATTQLDDADTADRMVARIGDFLEEARAGFEARAAVSTPNAAKQIREFAAGLTERSPYIPSWVNPSLDPRTLKASNVRVFLREYGSRSNDDKSDGDCFDGLLLDAAEQADRPEGKPTAVFAAIDTGAKKNAAALAIVGRWDVPEPNPTVIEAIAGLAGNPPMRSVYAPMVLRTWKPSPGHPLDLRLVVLPAMAALTLATGARTWSTDGFASHDIDIVAAERGITVEYVATSKAHEEVYQPVAVGLGRDRVCLSGVPLVEEAVTQLRRVTTEREVSEQGPWMRVVVPEDASGEHGDLGVALVRALAAAGCGKVAAYSWGVVAVPGRYAGADPRGAADMGVNSRITP